MAELAVKILIFLVFLPFSYQQSFYRPQTSRPRIQQNRGNSNQYQVPAQFAPFLGPLFSLFNPGLLGGAFPGAYLGQSRGGFSGGVFNSHGGSEGSSIISTDNTAKHVYANGGKVSLDSVYIQDPKRVGQFVHVSKGNRHSNIYAGPGGTIKGGGVEITFDDDNGKSKKVPQRKSPVRSSSNVPNNSNFFNLFGIPPGVSTFNSNGFEGIIANGREGFASAGVSKGNSNYPGYGSSFASSFGNGGASASAGGFI